MSRPRHNQPDVPDVDPSASSDSSGPISGRDSPAGLAHELANLLDASMRNLHLAITSLRDTAPDIARHGDADDPIARLDTVSQAMRQMTDLLRNWMSRRIAAGQWRQHSHSLAEAIEHALRLLRPAAEAIGVELRASISDAAANLPAGPIYPVIANGVRNSIEAIGTRGREAAAKPALVEVRANVEADRVSVTVLDTGPGLDDSLLDEHGRFRFGTTTKSGGHGLGLSLSRNVAHALRGSLAMSNRPGGGAELSLAFPVAALHDTDW